MEARLSGIETERSSRLPLSKKARRTLHQVESRPIEGGSVSSFKHVRRSSLRQGNTRVISQTALDHFRTALSTHKADPYSVLLRRNKLPMGLLEDESKSAGKVRFHLTCH